MYVLLGTAWYLNGTRRYKAAQGGTERYQGSTRRYQAVAQARFNEHWDPQVLLLFCPLPPMLWGGVCGAGLSQAAAVAFAAAGGGGACSLCCPSSAAPALSAQSGECAVLALNLQIKGLAMGEPPTPAFFRMLVENGERVADFCAKSVRVHA